MQAHDDLSKISTVKSKEVREIRAKLKAEHEAAIEGWKKKYQMLQSRLTETENLIEMKEHAQSRVRNVDTMLSRNEREITQIMKELNTLDNMSKDVGHVYTTRRQFSSRALPEAPLTSRDRAPSAFSVASVSSFCPSTDGRRSSTPRQAPNATAQLHRANTSSRPGTAASQVSHLQKSGGRGKERVTEKSRGSPRPAVGEKTASRGSSRGSGFFK